MIEWKELIKCIEKLKELPNGSGSEIEFCYQGIEYVIGSYKDSCDIQKASYVELGQDGELTCTDETAYTYSSLEELGKAKDIGFSVEECWPAFEEVCIKPDFDDRPFDEIYNAYKEVSDRWKDKK